MIINYLVKINGRFHELFGHWFRLFDISRFVFLPLSMVAQIEDILVHLHVLIKLSLELRLVFLDSLSNSCLYLINLTNKTIFVLLLLTAVTETVDSNICQVVVQEIESQKVVPRFESISREYNHIVILKPLSNFFIDYLMSIGSICSP